MDNDRLGKRFPTYAQNEGLRVKHFTIQKVKKKKKSNLTEKGQRM